MFCTKLAILSSEVTSSAAITIFSCGGASHAEGFLIVAYTYVILMRIKNVMDEEEM